MQQPAAPEPSEAAESESPFAAMDPGDGGQPAAVFKLMREAYR